MQCLRLGQMRITYRRLGLSVTTYSPYKVLDIQPGATKKEIKKAYRKGSARPLVKSVDF